MVYHDKPRESRSEKAGKAGGIAAAVLAVILALGAISGRVRRDISAQAEESIRRNVLEAAVQCYAIEGVYPSDVTYLEQNYGVRYDSRRYSVKLEAPDSNVLPTVTVRETD